jgi:PilX N-terminal
MSKASIQAFFARAFRPMRSERGVSLVVVLMLMVIILAMAGAGMLFSSIDLRASGNYRAGTQAFFAADTGVNDAMTRIGLDPTTSIAAFGPVAMSGGLKYCSGHVQNTDSCNSPQPLSAPQVITGSGAPGYNVNQGGPAFYQYQVNVTGVQPQLSAVREVEMQVQYGPVPQ